MPWLHPSGRSFIHRRSSSDLAVCSDGEGRAAGSNGLSGSLDTAEVPIFLSYIKLSGLKECTVHDAILDDMIEFPIHTVEETAPTFAGMPRWT